MKKCHNFYSLCKSYRIAISEYRESSYKLQKFVRKYDSEEEAFYVIRELPDPDGIFCDYEAAEEEAKRLLDLSSPIDYPTSAPAEDW